MQKIEINVQEPYLGYILSGKKTVEGRLNKGKFGSLKNGDILTIGSTVNEYEVIATQVYKNFREMIENEGVENVIPDKNSIDDAVAVYYNFYTPEQEKEFGVVAIKIKKVE